MSNTFDAKITQKNLVNESDLNEKIKTLATKEEIKALATKAELKTEQDEIEKLQTYDLSLFIGQSYFNNDGVQVYLIFEPIYETITFCKTFPGLTYQSQNGSVRDFQMKILSPLI